MKKNIYKIIIGFLILIFCLNIMSCKKKNENKKIDNNTTKKEKVIQEETDVFIDNKEIEELEKVKIEDANLEQLLKKSALESNKKSIYIATDVDGIQDSFNNFIRAIKVIYPTYEINVKIEDAKTIEKENLQNGFANDKKTKIDLYFTDNPFKIIDIKKANKNIKLFNPALYFTNVFVQSKVEFNKFSNIWDIVLNSKKIYVTNAKNNYYFNNFLQMLTKKEYQDVLKMSYEKLTNTAKAKVDEKINSLTNTTNNDIDYASVFTNFLKEKIENIDSDIEACNKVSLDMNNEICAFVLYKNLGIYDKEVDGIKNVKPIAYNGKNIEPSAYIGMYYTAGFGNENCKNTIEAFIKYISTTMDGFYPWCTYEGYYPNDNTLQKIDYSIFGRNEDKGLNFFMSEKHSIVEDIDYLNK